VLDYVCMLQTSGGLSITTTTLRYGPGHEASDHFPVLATVSSAKLSG